MNENISILIPEESRIQFVQMLKNAKFIESQEKFFQKRVGNGVFCYIAETGYFGYILD